MWDVLLECDLAVLRLLLYGAPWGGLRRMEAREAIRARQAPRWERGGMSDRCACGERLLVPQEKAGGKCMVCMIIEQQEEPEACQMPPGA